MAHLSKLKSISNRFKNFILATAFVMTQFVVPASSLFAGTATAAAGDICTIDTAGANDPSGDGQKDLTQLCVNYSGVPASIATTWNWDETTIPGGNTLDACNLFDTDGDGFANTAVCVTAGGSPIVSQAVTTYSCSDTKIDRCASPSSAIPTGTTTCNVSGVANDPFPAGDNYPGDTQGSCTISMAAVGGSTAKLIDVCSYPSASPTSVPDDCVIARPNSAKLEVVKQLDPETDLGRFDLKINGTIYASNVGDGGTTGTQVVTVDNQHLSQTVLEQANSTTNATSLNDYSTSVVCRDAHGTGQIIGNSSPTDATTRQLIVTIAAESDVVCTFTNTRANGTLTLVKSVTNDDGGTLGANDFGLTIDGNSTTSGTTVSLSPGSHTINEAGHSGYQFVSITGTGCPASLGGSVTVLSNQNVTCTITNDDIAPTLTLQKVVSGGTSTASDWTLTATPSDSNYASLSGKGDSFGNQTARANMQYTLTESGPTGYTGGLWTCDAGTLDGNTLTLPLGTHVTCSITNTRDTGTLILKKHVISNNGGTATAADFVLHVKQSASDVVGSPAAGSEAGTSYTLLTGSYTVSENTPTNGYAQTSIICDGQATATVSVTKDTTVTCVITNDDIAPKLTVIKHVDNSNTTNQKTASDFTMNVSGTNVSDDSFAGSEAGVDVSLDAGSYGVTEGSHSGYTVSYGADCTGTIEVGQTKTCTVTNTADLKPEIHIVKSGPATAHEGDTVTYTFTVTNPGNTPLSGVTVSDNVAGDGATLQSGDTNHNGKLDPGEEWILTVDYTIPTSQIPNVDNTATACGSDAADTQVCDTDNHTLDVLHPAISVVKSGPLYGYEGQQVGYSFVVTNIGDTPLTNVGIDDDIAIAELCDATTLAVGAHTDCTAMYLIPTPTIGDVTNHVIASGTDSLGETVHSNDQHTLTVIHPAIHVVKSGPATAHEGDTVTYTFTVTNAGDIALSSVTVTDNVAGNATYVSGDTNSNNKLDTTETWIFTKDYVIPTPQTENVVNTATACGYDPLNSSTCDTDTHNLDVLHPSIHVIKSGPATAYEGDTVTYTFTVTNTGDTPLDITSVNDDVAGDAVYQSGDTNSNGKLDLTETWVYAKDYTIPSNSTDITNTVTVCADDSLQTEDCDSDHHTTHVYHPTISVTKYVYTDAESDNGTFNLRIDGNTYATGGNSTTTGDILVTPGDHTVSESGANGTDLSDYDSAIACYVGEVYIGTSQDNPSGLGTSLDDVAVNGDQHAHCYIYNIRHAHLTIVKDAAPNDPQKFDFTLERYNPCQEVSVNSITNLTQLDEACNSFSSVDNFQLVDNTDPSTASKVESLSAANFESESDGVTYRLTEANTSGWTLTNLDCGDVEASYDGSSVSLTLYPGQDVTCTYTNTKLAKVTVIKDAQPDSLQAFTFTSDLSGDSASFNLTDSATLPGLGSKSFDNLMPGTYHISEAVASGWTLKNIDCGDATLVQDGSGISLTVKPGDNITCTFVNTKKPGHVLGASTVLPNTGQGPLLNFIAGGMLILLALGARWFGRKSQTATL